MFRAISTLALAALVIAGGCSSESTGPVSSKAPGPRLATASGSNINGIGGAMPAFYDAKLFTINFSELPPGGETANLARNSAINHIYQSDGCMPGGSPFVSVIDAIPTDGFNPLWQEVQLVFPNASSCRQFTSDDQILAAAAAGTVTLVPTTELYRCSVIGKSL